MATPLSRKDILCMVNLLAKTQQGIYNGRMYICVLLQECTNFDNDRERWCMNYLISWIESMLDGSHTLNSWQLANGIKDGNHQLDRMKWINWMVSQLEDEFKLLT